MNLIRHPSFILKPNPLRWLISGLLLSPALSLADGQIVPAAGPDGSVPIIDSVRGVPVLHPVAPSPRGVALSHFEQFNVGSPGLVINNSLVAGQSELAGALDASRQYQGQAASMIVNKVTGRHLSNIAGTQEIFGQAADYVLANPNGIYLNGASFINVPRASFVVGTPEFDSGRLSHLNTLEGQGLLEIDKDGVSNDTGALALIAPRIDSQGDLKSPGNLDLIVGNNRVQYDGNAITEIAQRERAEQHYDASLLGAMWGGRIRIVSTREGAGVRMVPALVQSRLGVDMRSAGDLQILGLNGGTDGGDLAAVNAGSGNLHLEAKGDLQMTAIEGTGQNIHVRAGKQLRLDAHTRQSLEESNENWDRKAWFITTETYDRKLVTQQTRQASSRLDARGNIHLQAGADATFEGLEARAGERLSAHAGGNLTVQASIDNDQLDETIAHRKHLWRGDSQRSENKDSARGSLLSGREVELKGGAQLAVRGSRVESADDITLEARQIDIETVALRDSSSSESYRGDLVSGTFFGNRGKDGDQGTRHESSQVEAGGTLRVKAETVAVRGSTVTGSKDALLESDSAGVFVESVQNLRKVESSQHDSKAFGIVSNKRTEQSDTAQSVGSVVASRSNLKIVTPGDVMVTGSTVAAEAALAIEAGKQVVVKPDIERATQTTETTERGFYAEAGETRPGEDGQVGSKQYAAGVGWDVEKSTGSESRSTPKPSELSGATAKVIAGERVEIDSSTLVVKTGDALIDAPEVAFTQTDAEHIKETSHSRSGGGMEVTGGMDRLGSASKGLHTSETSTARTHTPNVAKTDIAGDLNVIAKTVEQHGTKHRVQGEFDLQADTVNNRAVAATTHKVSESNVWEGRAGASVEYKDITRPIEKVVHEKEQSRLQQNGVEDAMDPPSVGIDLQFAHRNRKEETSSSDAVVTDIEAGKVKVQVAGRLTDEGTRYTATASEVDITANEHQLLAAADTRSKQLERLDLDASARVDTVTGNDINVTLLGIGSSTSATSIDSTAVPGSLSGKTGINIQLGTDGRYEGSRFRASEGPINVRGGGQLDFVQANDTQFNHEESLGGFGRGKVSTTPGAGKGVHLMGMLDGKKLEARDSQARIAEFDATGKVHLEGKTGLRLEGPRIGSAEQRPESIDLQSAGRVDVLAATDTHQAKGQSLGGALQLGASGNPTAGGKGGLAGGAFSIGRVDEESSTAKGAQFDSHGLNIASGSGAADAIRLQGLQAKADTLNLNAENGGVLVESAVSTDRRDNLALAIGAGVNGKKVPDDKTQNASALYGRVKVELEQLDSTLHTNSRLNANTLSLDSAGDARLAGATLVAGQVQGKVGGELHVESRQDQVTGLSVDLDTKLGKEKNPQGLRNGVASLAGPLGGKVDDKFGKQLGKVDPNKTASLQVDVRQQERNTVAEASGLSARDNINLNVQGDTHLTGAIVASQQGNISLGQGQTRLTDISANDYRAEGGINGSNAPADLAFGLLEASRKEQPGGANLGLLRGDGHNTAQQLKAGVQQP